MESAKEIISYRPDVLALSCCTTEHQYLLQLARVVKKYMPNIFVIMGGAHPTFFPEVIEEEDVLDAICRGEGEGTFVELIEALSHNGEIAAIKNLWVRVDGQISKNELRPLVDLDILPHYDRAIYYEKYRDLKFNPTKKFMISRGCPYNCTYCFNRPMKELSRGRGTYYRRKKISKVIEELKEVKETYGMKWVQFQDDVFNGNKNYLYEFLDLYQREIRLGFLCLLRVDNVDEEMVRRFKEAGLVKVHIGIETGNTALRKEVLNRNMSNEKIIEVGRLLNKYGIRIYTFNMVGLPGETLEMALETIKINRRFKVEYASCSIMQPYPGTDICKLLKEKGYLDENYSIRDLRAPYVDHIFDDIGTPLNDSLAQYVSRLSVCFNFLVYHFWAFPALKFLLKTPFWKSLAILNYFTLMKAYIKYAGGFKQRVKETFQQLQKSIRIISLGFTGLNTKNKS